MLKIRTEQMEAFRQGAIRSFENEMVVHLAEFSPPLFNAVKELQLRKAIQLGLERADRYGFNCRGPVRLYLELMLLFGSYFDTDPQYPWAKDILTDCDSVSQMRCAERLYERTLDYRKKVNGPRDAYTLKALRNISAMARQPLPLSASDLVPSMLREIARVYPEKAVFVGDERIKRLINEGIAAAQKEGFSTVRAIALTVVLMFAFGHGCFGDPLYPWIARTLDDEKIVDSHARANRLENRALTWLDHVLKHFDKEEST